MEFLAESTRGRSSKAPLPPQRQVEFGLEALCKTIQDLTGLEVVVYPAPDMGTPAESIDRLPYCFRKHTSEFCTAVMDNATGRGCDGYDFKKVNRLAGEAGHAFVKYCHAGLAEAVVPVYCQKRHLATIFVGQAVTEKVAKDGFEGIRRRLTPLGVNFARLESAFRLVQSMPESKLLSIGQIVEVATRGIADALDAETFEREVFLQRFPQLLRALRLVRQDDGREVTLATVAHQVRLHPAYLSRLFKRVMGVGFKDFVTQRRIRRACKMLVDTRLLIGEVAHACGFSRQSYFTRCFKKRTGMTPSEYRSHYGRGLGPERPEQ